MHYQLEDIINKELLFNHAINLLIADIDDKVGQHILSWYVLNELPLDHTEEEFHQKYELLLTQGTLVSLCDKQLLEFDFETQTYTTTKLGEEVKRKINGNNSK